jgi:metallo-beta-lactamase family protein
LDIQFLGAAAEVTGSCHLIRDPGEIDVVILSHAHIDHSGRVPLLVKRGYKGTIYAQRACRDLCAIMLRDSAYLQEKDAQWDNRKRARKGLEPREPLYTTRDAKRALRQFEGLDYGERNEILPGVVVRLFDAGHILGSAIVELTLTEANHTRTLLFSGDLGHADAPILRDPTVVKEADLVMLESTYGDRNHRSRDATQAEMHEVLENALDGRGNVLIPAFAVGRTQEMLYILGENYGAWGLDRWRIFLDSPLAIEATEIYMRHSDLYDAEATAAFERNREIPFLPNVTFSKTPQQSMAINRIQSGAIVIAASGMCNGGRIKHHLKHNVWRRDCHVVIVGYQAEGTLGRRLVDGASHIRLWGETIRVKASVHTIGGFSAHADQTELTRWYGHLRDHPPAVLVHGEPPAAEALSVHLRERFNTRVTVAQKGDRFDLRQLRPVG